MQTLMGEETEKEMLVQNLKHWHLGLARPLVLTNEFQWRDGNKFDNANCQARGLPVVMAGGCSFLSSINSTVCSPFAYGCYPFLLLCALFYPNTFHTLPLSSFFSYS